ncbi:MAG: ECF transporter S component [Erysipelotrichia bacterium]|nr:ECF transporter S component [Erysipelotrichia bacterium]
MKQEKTKALATSALMIALIFVCTYTIKVPNPATGGYSHMGDCMIFLAVMLLGKKQGALAGGLGAALSDLLTGATLWVLPTFIIKWIMGWLMGSILEKYAKNQHMWIISAVIGGIWQGFAYTLVKIPLFNLPTAIASIPGISMQTLIGLLIYVIIAKALEHTKVIHLQGVVNQ